MINNAKLQLGITKLNQIQNNQNYKPILTFVKLKSEIAYFSFVSINCYWNESSEAVLIGTSV